MITSKQADVVVRLTNLALKVVAFFSVLIGVAACTVAFMYCVMHDKGGQAKAISGYGALVFFTAFGKIVWSYFDSGKPTVNDSSTSGQALLSKDESSS